MPTARSLVTRLIALGFLSLAACGGDPPPPPAAPALPPPPPPAPVETAPPVAEPEPTSAADAGAPPTASTGSGRPPVLKTSDTEITDTFGISPGAKLEIGGDTDRATLKIPEGALSTGTNITFKLEPKGKSHGAPLGKVYRTRTQIGGSAAFTRVDTAGPPFELQVPAGNKKDANLAIGEITTDDKGKEKITWTVLAPKRIDDVSGVATFELGFLSDAFLHVTTKAPTAPK
jgi:hypothetical protein